VLSGRLRPGYKLMNVNGVEIGEIKSIQREKESVDEATQGDQLAISIDTQFTFGRQVNEGDSFYTEVPRAHFQLLTTKFKQHLSDGEITLLVEIRRIAGDVFLA